MATEGDRQEERDRMDNDPFNSNEQDDHLESERQASTSTEPPSTVTRSTEDLTIGGTKKQPQGQTTGEDTADCRSSSEQSGREPGASAPEG